jgi:hypothetical protein
LLARPTCNAALADDTMSFSMNFADHEQQEIPQGAAIVVIVVVVCEAISP